MLKVNIECQNLKLGCRIQNSDIEHKTWISNTKLRCRTQNLDIEYKTQMSNTKLGYRIQNMNFGGDIMP